MENRHDFAHVIGWAAASLGRDPDQLAGALGIAPRTLRHWKTSGKVPAWAQRALRLYAGDLAALPDGDAWAGWRLHGGALRGPDGSEWRPDDLYRFRCTVDHLNHLRAQHVPGSQLTWAAPGGGRRDWPGASVPTWRQLEEALRGVVVDALRDAAR